MAQGGIVYRESWNEKIRNGSAFETGRLDLQGCQELVVPRDTDVREGAPPGQLEAYLEKRVSFGGHPPSPITIDEGRHYMGVAWQRAGSQLTLGTYGEFGSFEGGAGIRLLVVVPAGLAVTRQDGLSGERSRLQGRDDIAARLRDPRMERCYWYGPTECADGWQPIRTELDPEMTAGRAVTGPEAARAALAGRRSLSHSLWKLKAILDREASSFNALGWDPSEEQKATRIPIRDAQLAPTLEACARDLPDQPPVLAGLRERATRLRATLDAGLGLADFSELYEWVEELLGLLPDDEGLPTEEYLEDTTALMQDATDQLMSQVRARIEADPENPMARMMSQVLALGNWKTDCSLELHGPPEAGSPMERAGALGVGGPFMALRGDRWIAALSFQHDAYRVYIGGALPGGPRAGPVQVDPGAAELDEHLAVEGPAGSWRPSAIELSFDTDARGFARGRFAFETPGRRWTGTFENVPVLQFRCGLPDRLPEGSSAEAPPVRLELLYSK